MKIDKDKFGEVYDAGCWPYGITEDEEKIIQFVLEHHDHFGYVTESISSYDCDCVEEAWNQADEDQYSGEFGSKRFEQLLKRYNAEIYRFESFYVDRKLENDSWMTFYFDEVNEMYNEETPISVFIPFYHLILESDPSRLRDMILHSDEAWRGFCVIQCPKCKHWSICD